MNPGTPAPAGGLIVLSTFPNEHAARDMACLLVRESLAACVNILPGIRSIYSWEGRIESTQEVLAVIKTTAERYPAMEARMLARHPFKVPEIVALPASAISPDFARWLQTATTPPP